MKRSVALLAVVVSLLLGVIPTAHALGAGICTISGTINFSTSPQTPMQGTWHIESGVIECRGLFNQVERIVGPGSFTGSGFYGTMAPGHRGACLHQVGSGTVDYRIPTSEQDVHLIEPQTFVLAGAGSFTTPTLKGTFQVTPPDDSEGDCLTKPLSRAVFLAQAAMVRPPGGLVGRLGIGDQADGPAGGQDSATNRGAPRRALMDAPTATTSSSSLLLAAVLAQLDGVQAGGDLRRWFVSSGAPLR